MPLNALLVNFLPLACVSVEPPPADRALHGTDARAWAAGTKARGVDAAARRWSLRDADPVPPPGAYDLLDNRVVPGAVGARTLEDAAIADDVGEALDARMDEFPRQDRNETGLGLLTMAELFGDGTTPGLCEMPELRVDVDADGQDYEASLAVYTYTAIVNEPEPMLVSISTQCVSGLATAGGDVDAAVDAGACADDEAHTFFADGSACRACVEQDGGDYAACQASEACPEQAPLAVWMENADGERRWYRGVYANLWACAPDWLAPAYILADYDDDAVLPESFDHDRWAFLCTPFWNAEDDASEMTCVGGFEPGERGVLAEGLYGFVSYLRPKGDDVLGWRGREYYVDSVGVDNGATIRWWWASAGGLAALSAPRVIEDDNGDGEAGPDDVDWGYGSGGFGLDPHDTRPDGELLARDWLATMAMKTSTTIDGLPIVVSQRSRCADGAWTGPDDDGSYRCGAMDAPEVDWLNDAYVPWADTDHTGAGAYPVVTLGSTGMIDPDVPGGFVVHLAGSTTLADPDWDDCTLPHTFVPDVAPFEDTPVSWGGPAALDGQTWRFGVDDRPDFRVILSTNRKRGWCGGTADGGGYSALDLLTTD